MSDENELARLRERIDATDRSILELLAKRLELVEEVGKYKKIRGIPPLQPQRWREVLENRKSLGKSLGLEEPLVESIWESIHETALKREAEI